MNQRWQLQQYETKQAAFAVPKYAYTSTAGSIKTGRFCACLSIQDTFPFRLSAKKAITYTGSKYDPNQ